MEIAEEPKKTTGRGSGEIFFSSPCCGRCARVWSGSACLVSPNGPRAPTPPWASTAESKVKGGGDGQMEVWNFVF